MNDLYQITYNPGNGESLRINVHAASPKEAQAIFLNTCEPKPEVLSIQQLQALLTIAREATLSSRGEVRQDSTVCISFRRTYSTQGLSSVGITVRSSGSSYSHCLN